MNKLNGRIYKRAVFKAMAGKKSLVIIIGRSKKKKIVNLNANMSMFLKL